MTKISTSGSQFGCSQRSSPGRAEAKPGTSALSRHRTGERRANPCYNKAAFVEGIISTVERPLAHTAAATTGGADDRQEPTRHSDDRRRRRGGDSGTAGVRPSAAGGSGPGAAGGRQGRIL